MPTIEERERERGKKLMADLAKVLIKKPWLHTPFMDRFFTLFHENQTAIYQVKLPGGAVGRRFQHGGLVTPSIVECVESCAKFGKKDMWWVKVVG